ncbi:MAG: DUF4173 domain-containing protein [Pseudomonadota bacterium]
MSVETRFVSGFLGISPVTERAILALGLVIVGDLLFWGGRLGLGIPVFLAALAVAIMVANPVSLRWPGVGRAGLVLILALATLIEHVGPLSTLIGIAGVAGFALIMSGRLRQTVEQTVCDSLRVICAGPLWLLGDLLERVFATRVGRMRRMAHQLALWSMPVALGGIFLLLFRDANPVLLRWSAQVDLAALLEVINPWRILFWLLIAAAVWGFLHVRARKPVAAGKSSEPTPAPPLVPLLFGTGAILRGLLLFNLIFAIQTLLDLAFLWSGVSLPEGMTYANYAHRGAYPLIFAALLAGGFTLLATRAGSDAARSPLIRWLSYVWIAQTVWLVVSSILRLNLYVGVYALSEWRVAAFIWMGLVAVGLVLIVARLAFGRSNAWLVNCVLLAGMITLYAASFVNISGLIARHNVAVSREVAGGPGQPLDRGYLCSLGPAALPALHSFNRTLGYRALYCDPRFEPDFRDDMENWRNWSLRNLRLLAALETLAPPGPEHLSYRDLDNGARLEPWP